MKKLFEGVSYLYVDKIFQKWFIEFMIGRVSGYISDVRNQIRFLNDKLSQTMEEIERLPFKSGVLFDVLVADARICGNQIIALTIEMIDLKERHKSMCGQLRSMRTKPARK